MSIDVFIDSLIHNLRQRDVRLFIENDELSVDAPKGVLQPDDVGQLRTHKRAIIEFLQRHARRFEPPPLVPLPKLDPVPLSLAQQRLWIVDQLAGPHGAMRYHVPSAILLRGPLNVDALRRTLDELIARHEVLRSTITTVDGMPVQSISIYAKFALQSVDLSGRAFEERQAALHRRLLHEMQQPFNLRAGPLIVGCLVKIADDQHVLFVKQHHIISDGWAGSLMWREICALYDAFSRDLPSPLVPVRVQYSDYAQWQRSWLHGTVLENHIDYWKRQLADVPPLELRLDRERTSPPTFQGGVTGFVVPLEINAALRVLATESGASLFMTLFAVFHVLLSRLSGQRDFAVSSVVAGRNYPGTEDLVGMCVNNLVLRVSADRGMTFRQLLARTRTVVLDAYAHQDLPYEELVAELRIDGWASSPVAFVMGSASRNAVQMRDLQIEPVVLPWSTAKNELLLSMEETPRGLFGALEYASDVFESWTMERLGRRFLEGLRQVIANPDVQLDDIDITLDGDSDAEYFYTARYIDDRSYWTSPCADSTPVGLSVGMNMQGDSLSYAAECALHGASRDALAQTAMACGVVLRELLQAAAVLYLHKATDVNALCLGIIAQERGDTLPVLFDIDAAANVSQFVRHCADRIAEAARRGRCGSAHIRRLRRGDAQDDLQFRTVVEVTDDATPVRADTVELQIRIGLGDTIRIDLVGDSKLFELWELDAHARALDALLARLVAPGALDAELHMLSLLDDDMCVQLSAWSEGDAAVLPTKTRINALFESRVDMQPDAIAVRHGEVEVGYRTLNARANRIAHRLRAIGVTPGAFVVVCLGRCVDLIAALLAVLKCGAAYVPVDPATSAERLSYIVGDTRPAAILTVSKLVHLLPNSSAKLLVLDADADAIAQQPDFDPPRGADDSGDALAYVIYTSGSTGEPKGVLIEHANLINHAMWAQREFGLVADDRALQFASISFDASAEEIFPTLLAGAAIVIRRVEVPSALELINIIIEQRITVLNLPTAYWHAFVEALAGERIRIGSLRLIIVGGERVSLESLQRWRRLAGDGVEWVNTYGPTEATISSTLYRAPRDLRGLADIPIGRPIDNVLIRLLDKAGQPVPAGVVGELCIGGSGVARGYLRRGTLTAEKFVVDPYGADCAARLYRTGDLARWRWDGELMYVGRNDDQIKLSGFRIEPGEIEAQLRATPHVREVAVVVREDLPGDKRLVAYVSCVRPQQAMLADAMRTRLQQSLPAYMVPSAFVVLDALPMTLNGKLDRQALPAPVIGSAQHGVYEAPQGPTEETLAELWQDVLSVVRVGRHDNYFELGGSSISAIQLIGRANKASLKLTLSLIFEHQTIAGLAQVLAQTPGGTAAPETSRRRRAAQQAPERGGIAGPVPFTPIQLGALRQGEDVVRNLLSSQVLSCRRALSPELLRVSLRKLVRYHDALRLRILRSDDGAWSQAIAPIAEVGEYELLQLEALDTVDGIGVAVGASMERLQERLDSSIGLLLQATLIDIGQSHAQVLLLVVHHFAIDPISWAILLHDLQSIYEQLEAGTPVRVPLKGTSIKQWAEGIESYANSPAALSELEYWQGLAWESYAPLPVERNSGAESTETLCVSIMLDQPQTRALLDAAIHTHSAQINEVLLAALVCALWQWSGLSEFALGMYHHGRVGGIEGLDGLDMSRTVGWFSAPVPLLLGIAEDASIATTLRDVRERLRAMPNEGFGHAILQHLRRAPDRLPEVRIDVLLNHQGTVAGEAPGGLFTTHFDNGEYADVLREAVLPWKIAVLSNVADGCLCVNFVSMWYDHTTLGLIADSFKTSLCGLAGLMSIDQTVST
jgi:amino acid adenylation domain-containing protein